MEHLLSLATTLLSMIWISQALIWSISSHWVIGYDLTQYDLNQSGIDMEHLLSLATTLLSMIWISQALICSISSHWLRPYLVWSESVRHWYGASTLIGYDLTQYDLNQSGIDMEHLLSLATTLLSMIWISQALICSISSHWLRPYSAWPKSETE